MKHKEAGIIDITNAGEGLEDDYITRNELEKVMLSDHPAIVIDLRKPSLDTKNTIEAAINITLEDLLIENVKKYVADFSTPIVLVCAQSFEMTRMMPLTTLAYPTLKIMGYTHVKVLRDWGKP